MTSEQFVIWMQGFVEGSNNYNLTPAGWDAIKAKLKEVQEYKELVDIFRPSYTDPVPPYNPKPCRYTSPSIPDERFKVTCGEGIITNNVDSPETIASTGALKSFNQPSNVAIGSKALNPPFQHEPGIAVRALKPTPPQAKGEFTIGI